MFRVVYITIALATTAQAELITFKQGAPNPFGPGTYSGTEDVMLAVNNAGNGAWDQNFGGRWDFSVGGVVASSFYRHSLLRFDVTSLAGQYSSIDAATLRLYFGQAPGTTSTGVDTVEVYQLASANADWTEGVKTGGPSSANPGESTWGRRHWSAVSWAGSLGASMPGVDYENSVIASTAYTNTEAANDPFDLVFTDVSFFADWIAGDNPGLFLRTVTENQNQIGFHSSEGGTGAYYPELIVSYTPVPEPRSLLLLALPALAWAGIRVRRARARG